MASFRTRRLFRRCIILFPVISIILGGLYAGYCIWRDRQPFYQPTSVLSEDQWLTDTYIMDPPTFRSDLNDFGYFKSTELRCWPSVGGIVILEHATPVEQMYVGLRNADGSATARSLEPEVEDDFCRQLRRMGGKWWATYHDYEWARGMIRWQMEEEKEILHLCWPEGGGVWLKRFENRHPHGFNREPLEWPELERMRMAETMEERCQAIADGGGTFYSDPRENEYVDRSLASFGEHGPVDYRLLQDIEVMEDIKELEKQMRLAANESRI